MPAFDLVRQVPGRSPVIRIDGEDARVGVLPGARLHRRHLIKYAAPVCSASLNPDDDITAGSLGDGVAEPAPGGGVRAVTAVADGHGFTVGFTPPLPDATRPAGGTPSEGTWVIEVDGARVTGGTWSLRPAGTDREVTLQVTQRWRPRRLPLLMRLVTTVVPVFRRWPTTYAWRGVVTADGAVRDAGWSRTGAEDGTDYRRATGS
ncbi:MAG: hypothetical protein ITG02_12760 [Patulibacter sp.]|nr:hypothetical protein [Patulibacter sp.]